MMDTQVDDEGENYFDPEGSLLRETILRNYRLLTCWIMMLKILTTLRKEQK